MKTWIVITIIAGGMLLGAQGARAHTTCGATTCCTPHGGTTVGSGYNTTHCLRTTVVDGPSDCGGGKVLNVDYFTFGRSYCSSGTGTNGAFCDNPNIAGCGTPCGTHTCCNAGLHD